jgi:hypothetical protein
MAKQSNVNDHFLADRYQFGAQTSNDVPAHVVGERQKSISHRLCKIEEVSKKIDAYNTWAIGMKSRFHLVPLNQKI